MIFNPIRLELPVLAVAKSRAKRGAHGQAYIPPKTKSFEAEIRWHWNISGAAMIPKVATRVFAICFIPKPPSVPKKQLIPIVKPDLDNVVKAILDSLNGFAWKDDNQVSDLRIVKRYTSGSPLIVLHIEPDEVEAA